MLAYRVVRPGYAELLETPTPAPGPGEVLVRTTAVGLCHSDVFISQAPTALGMELPVTLGHEIVGTVEGFGEGVTDWTPGAPAAVYVLIGCGECTRCCAGEDNLCRRGYRGVGTHRDGGMAEFVVVPAANLVAAAGIEPESAAPLTDAGLTALHAVAAGRELARDRARILVIGIGGLGHLALQMVLGTESAEVFAADIAKSARALARTLGAHHVLDGDSTEVLDLAGGREIDLVLDFVGTNDTLALARRVTNRGSAVVVAGLGEGRLTVQATAVSELSPEVAVRRVSAGSRADLVEVMDLGRRGLVKAETTRYPLGEAAAALADLERGAVTGRAVLVP